MFEYLKRKIQKLREKEQLEELEEAKEGDFFCIYLEEDEIYYQLSDDSLARLIDGIYDLSLAAALMAKIKEKEPKRYKKYEEAWNKYKQTLVKQVKENQEEEPLIPVVVNEQNNNMGRS